ncbi:MAG: ABC transporter permease [Acidimicrobiales bacterium]
MFQLLPPILFGLAFLVLWELFVVVRHVKPFLLPRPTAIWHELVANRAQIFKTSRVTGANALVGLTAGTGAGVAASFVASRYRTVKEVITPLALGASTIPIIVLVSVFDNMFAQDSEVPRRLMATVVVFFVMFINVSRGLIETRPTEMELMRSYAASDWQVLRKVRVPGAMAYFAIALKVSAPLAVVTAFVSEYFGGRQNGLGNRITSAIANSKDAAGWAYVVAACAVGIVFYIGATGVERLATPWQRRGPVA